MQWSHRLFGRCDLGDVRRTRRLVDVGARLSRHAGASLAQCCQGDTAAVLGSYRLIGNEKVAPAAIAAGGFSATVEAAQEAGLLLAVEDSTSLSYAHAVAAELGTTGSQRQARHRGFMVHSVLLIEADSERTVGLVEQRHWCRAEDGFGKKHDRKRRAYEEKESYKWQQASERMANRMGEAMTRTISVCDRESDIYEYLRYKGEHAQRFVIRAQSDRSLSDSDQSLFASLAGEQVWQYETSVMVAQRGGRPARQAKVRVCGHSVTLRPPADRGRQAVPLTVNVVVVRDLTDEGQDAALNWVLLTSEPVDTAEQLRRVVRYYELRWRIEEYHKAWKSGVGVERSRLQSAANLERMLVITAFLAVRLLQLREQLLSRDAELAASTACDQALEAEEWKVLWLVDQETKPPASAPTARWACLAIARLGGFTDTKRTGRPGWDTLWRGWMRLQERIEGFRLASRIALEM